MVSIKDIEAVIAHEKVHSAISKESILRFGVDSLFYARVPRTLPDGTNIDVYVPPSSVWVPGEPISGSTAIYSKSSFNYVAFRAVLPSLPLPDNTDVYLGLENTSGYGAGGLFCFALFGSTQAVRVSNHYITDTNRYVNIGSVFPADYDTATHTYSVLALPNLFVAFIDTKPVCFAVNAPDPDKTAPLISPPPYGILFPCAPLSPELCVLIEVLGDTSLSLPHEGVSAVRFPMPIPLTLPLYLESSETKMAGYSASGDVTSHPFPALGFRQKSILFMADQNGTFYYDVMDINGNWREYDSLSVSANILLPYNPTADSLLGRIRFSPAVTPVTILTAEVHLVP